MKKLRRLLSVLTLTFVILVSSTSSIGATSGKLKQDSIVSCGGQDYGYHGNGHWHEAVHRGDSGWYASGSDLGFDNPCSTSEPEAPVRNEPPQQSAEEKARIERAEAEKARIEKERIEKEKLEQERLNDVTVKDVQIGKKSQEFSETTLYYAESLDDIKINLNNGEATVSFDEEAELKLFEINDIKAEIISENKEVTKLITLPVFCLGSNKELNKQKVVLRFGKRQYTNRTGYFELYDKDYKGKITSGDLFVGETMIAQGKDITLEEVSRKKYTHLMKFAIADTDYSIPLKVKEVRTDDSEGAGILVGGVLVYANIYLN